MAASLLTTPASDELCRNGCGRPRATVGRGFFSLTLPYCLDCSAELAAREAAQVSPIEARTLQLVSLDEELGPALASRTLSGTPVDGGRGEAVAKAAAWLEDCLAGAKTNLYLCGPVGEGKTSLAASLAREAAARGCVAHFYVLRDWLDSVRQAQFEGPGVDHEQRARRAELLVLDDVGSERATPFAFERLLSLVDHRYRFELPTVVTSNLTPAELAAALGKEDAAVGERIVSRLVEDAVKVRLAYGNLRLASREAAAA